jgi:hypothetical protein
MGAVRFARVAKFSGLPEGVNCGPTVYTSNRTCRWKEGLAWNWVSRQENATIKNGLENEHKISAQCLLKPTVGHDPEPVPSTSHSHKVLPDRCIYSGSLFARSRFLTNTTEHARTYKDCDSRSEYSRKSCDITSHWKLFLYEKIKEICVIIFVISFVIMHCDCASFCFR